MASYKPKSKWRGIVGVVVIIAALIAACAVFVGFSGKDTEKISASAFSRGDLNSSTGEYLPSETSVYTKKAFKCLGLRVEPDFEFNGTYDVYYYTSDERFLEVKLNLSGVYTEDYPPLAQLARVVVHPVFEEDEDDEKINFWEESKYAKMVTVTVNKEQKNIYAGSVNLYDEDSCKVGKNFKEDTNANVADFDSKNLVDCASTVNKSKVTSPIYIDGSCDKYDIYFYLEVDVDRWPVVALFGADGKVIKDEDNAYVFKTVEPFQYKRPTWVKVTIEVPELDSYEGVHLMASISETSECYIYGYGK